jgi:hypothetical protein
MKKPSTMLGFLLLGAFAEVQSHSTEPPQHGILKLGTVDFNLVETSPIIWKGRLLRLESIRSSYIDNTRADQKSFFRFRDISGGNITSSFGVDYAFGSSFVVGDTVYVYGTNPSVGPVGPDKYGGGDHIRCWWSKDLISWQNRTAVEFPKDVNGTVTSFRSFNNDVWAGKLEGRNAYVMPIELGDPPAIVGQRFTMGFAVSYASTPEAGWEFLDPTKYIYNKAYYSACPAVWFEPESGYWYMVYLRTYSDPALKVYAEDVVRSRDLVQWEEGKTNPLIWKTVADTVMSNEPDALTDPKHAAATHAMAKKCAHKNIDQSDIDFIEIKTGVQCAGCPKGPAVYINYNWGDQSDDCEFLAAGVYNGTLKSMFEGLF